MALVYIVEDDRNIREIEEYALKNSGYDVRCFDEAVSFREALGLMLPDMVLLDIILPGEDGLSVLKKLRENPVTRNVPVIVVTAKGEEIDTVKGLDRGRMIILQSPSVLWN